MLCLVVALFVGQLRAESRYLYTGTVVGVTIGTITVDDGLGSVREFQRTGVSVKNLLERPWEPVVGDRVNVYYTMDVDRIERLNGESQLPGRRGKETEKQGKERNPLEGVMDDRAFFMAFELHFFRPSNRSLL
jgi:hypothetical protein